MFRRFYIYLGLPTSVNKWSPIYVRRYMTTADKNT